MARHVNIASSEEFPSQKRNSADKAPFMRGGQSSDEGNPFSSQFFTPKATYNSRLREEETEKSMGGQDG
jgi:hypothetical protein